MRKADLVAEKRTGVGKGVARRARAAGCIPAVVYGENIPPEPLTIERRAFERIMAGVEGLNVIITLKCNGGDVLTLIKDVQYDPVDGNPLHVDFLRVSTDHKITTSVPIHLINSAIGVREGGILEFVLRQVEIECLPQDIPDYIPLDIAGLGMSQSLHVRDLPASELYSIVTDPDRVVVSVISTAKLEALAAAAETPATAASEAGGEQPAGAAAN